jgi:3-hydroxyacyl-CoA dehydrogenase
VTTMAIQKAAVLGAGVMGSGIAAHIANAGVPVVLLDIVPKGANNRNVIADTAVQKMLKADPAPFMHAGNAKLITTGNLEDDLDRLKDCDWIVEAVLEDLGVKHRLYEKLESVRKADAVISSNTSTIPLKMLRRRRRSSSGSAISATGGSAKASSSPRTRPASSPTASAATGSSAGSRTRSSSASRSRRRTR